MPPRRCKNMSEVLDRREKALLMFLEGNQIQMIARELDVHVEQIRQDLDAMYELLNRVDGMLKVSESRRRVIAGLWEEISLSHRQEEIATSGAMPDWKAAANLQANRLKAYAQIAKMFSLDKPDPEMGEKKVNSWIDLVRAAANKIGG